MLPGQVVTVLLDQRDVSCDDGRNKMRLAGTRFLYFARLRVHAIVMAAVIAGVGIVQIRDYLDQVRRNLLGTRRQMEPHNESTGTTGTRFSQLKIGTTEESEQRSVHLRTVSQLVDGASLAYLPNPQPDKLTKLCTRT